MSHSIEVVRLPGREPVPVKSLQLSLDDEAWAWSLTASLPFAALDLVSPTREGPVELEITLDGITWVMLVETIDTRREFGTSELSIRGRSRAAWLAAPYAPTRSFVASAPYTARQLAEQELTRAGLVTGFELDWQLPDWLVPAGAWSYQGETPLAALLQIVGSVGGVLTAHPSARRLAARSRYPEPPWRWDRLTPDITLPLDVMRTLQSQWQEQPAFNAVFIAGESQGVVGRVVRAGTAGDLLAPMIVDPLVTHADAARERGTRVLSDTGRQALVTVEVPLLPSIGLLDPGRVVAVDAPNDPWRGLVRATSIQAAWNDALSVRQTIELERHFL